MKKSLKIAAMLVFGAAMFASCNQSDLKGFKKTSKGLNYKFIVENKNAQKAEMGDVINGEMIFRFNEDTLFNNMGDPRRIVQINENMFDGDVSEGFAMLHVGDHAIFAVEADSLAKLFNGQMPEGYEPGKGHKFFYEIKVNDIVTKEEIAQEASNFQQEMAERQEKEPAEIAEYVSKNNITVKPNADGLYVIVKKKGTGAKVTEGKAVKINYTGRLLDGKVFDTSIESIAKENGIYEQRRPYEPVSYTVGQMGLIKGWQDGVMGQPAGTILQLIMPSSLGYGAQGAGKDILPYSPLVFDIEIVSVN